MALSAMGMKYFTLVMLDMNWKVPHLWCAKALVSSTCRSQHVWKQVEFLFLKISLSCKITTTNTDDLNLKNFSFPGMEISCTEVFKLMISVFANHLSPTLTHFFKFTVSN